MSENVNRENCLKRDTTLGKARDRYFEYTSCNKKFREVFKENNLRRKQSRSGIRDTCLDFRIPFIFVTIVYPINIFLCK